MSDSTIIIPTRGKCPECLHEPQVWKERPAYGSRELFWIGCRTDGHIAGGITPGIAVQNWDRVIASVKYNLERKKWRSA